MSYRFRFVIAAVFILALFVGGVSYGGQSPEGPTNPLFKETKVKNYLPHMTWKEVEEALTRTDMVIIPVGSIEQHGKHLPLCTDIYTVNETAKLIAQQTDVLVAPAVFVGLSEHHMGFPGSLTLTPATFEAVVYEVAQSLIHHGFDRIMIYNGHGGNNVSVANIVQKINQTTSATAVFLNQIELPPEENPEENIPFDSHAGENETSTMLYLAPRLVDMSQAEKPVLTIPPTAQKALDNMESEPNLRLVQDANMWRPKEAGKQASTREMTNIGVFTTGDPKKATAERGRRSSQRFIDAAVKFINEWKKISS
jgi:creatinine amidohydrolase